ncbi:kinase-like domain-containing protein [Rhizophagus irregularis DAOM 181602=DAOM 197198]|nr:kinase-like domain-containing protein [Rhizophagus irregularis DAOM 181602=DAOM 197198]
MDISNQNLDTTKTDAKNLWKEIDNAEYQYNATIFSADSTTESDETTSLLLKRVNIMDLEKRKEVYGLCGECNEPGTGYLWCQPCNAKRFEENFKNWTSGNKNIDELIQQSQLNAFFCTKFLEWIPFEKFENVTYLTRGGFSKIYSAYWPEGNIGHWDIENQKWIRGSRKVALKSLNNSSNISNDFLNEIKYYISGHFPACNTVICFGITQDPNTKDYIMVLQYFEGGNLRNTLVEVLRGYQYTKAADIYSFGIIMNELMSERIPYNDIPHDQFLVVKICKGFRPKISEDTPKLIVDLIIKCWDAKAENRPTTKELRQILEKYLDDVDDEAIYTSRLLKFENLPEPVNSTNYLSSFQEPISSSSTNLISERLDCELNELDLDE